MKNLNDTLPELMRRATENLEPESTDLVERGMARGLTLRRRRTALISLTGATAIVATAGVIVGGSQLFAKDAQPPAASTSTTQSTTVTKEPAKAVLPKETLATFVKLLPPRLKVSKSQAWEDGIGNQVYLQVDDGKGLSELTVAVRGPGMYKRAACDLKQTTGTCTPRPDGSVRTVMEDSKYGQNASEVLKFSQVLVIRRRDR
jgi:hypothetical protein